MEECTDETESWARATAGQSTTGWYGQYGSAGAAKEIDSSSDTVVMYVGPEGGWSEDDMELLKDVTWVSLGERILRTETAAIVGVHSILQSILNT